MDRLYAINISNVHSFQRVQIINNVNLQSEVKSTEVSASM